VHDTLRVGVLVDVLGVRERAGGVRQGYRERPITFPLVHGFCGRAEGSKNDICPHAGRCQSGPLCRGPAFGLG
jgi:hypothetical protein